MLKILLMFLCVLCELFIGKNVLAKIFHTTEWILLLFQKSAIFN